MRRPAACLTAMILAACSPEPKQPRIMLAAAADAESVDAPTAQSRPDPAADARAFFFGQAQLYLAGADPATNPPLGGILHAMGRSDLVATSSPGFNCPRQWVEPAEMISRLAAGSQVVLIEAEPGDPAQVAFVRQLIARMASEGVSAFADETLTLESGGGANPEVMLVTEGLVTRDTGQAKLHRDVKRLGLDLIDAGVWWASAGELAGLSLSEQAARRHAGLALQMGRRVFAGDPQARILVFAARPAGAPHNNTLGAEIVQFTGHAPFVIRLTRCAGTGARSAFLSSAPRGAAPGTQPDLVFAIPEAEFRSGRRQGDPGERLVPVPNAMKRADQPVLVEVRRTSDPELAMPEDRLMLFPGNSLPLLLPPGEFRIEAWTKNGPLAEPVSLTVD